MMTSLVRLSNIPAGPRGWGWVLVAALLCPVFGQASAPNGWLNWRGAHQTGVSDEIGLPVVLEAGGNSELWTFDMSGRGEVVVAGERAYVWGYSGDGPDLREYLTCLNAVSGETVWQLGFNDFLSDTVYSRYSIGAPTVDPETGNIYLMTTAGEMVCVTSLGEVLWSVSMMERYGMLTFPNGRRGAPVIEGDLVIHHAITSYWGADAPARDRFYAFDKSTGALVWSCTPGTEPKDSSFSTPVIAWQDGYRVLYAGTGCGNVVAINARTGQALWRFDLSTGGVNASLVIHDDDKVIAIHGTENLDSSEVGRMVAVRLPSKLPGMGESPLVLGKADELWRNPLTMFTSSPVLVGDRVYQMTKTGELVCVDANTGNIVWSHKMANSQLHASPLYAAGRLYIPLENGELHVLKVKPDGVETLSVTQLEGACLGAPTPWNGRVYVHTTKKLYCFGSAKGSDTLPMPVASAPFRSESVTPSQLQPIPSDLLLQPGQQGTVKVRGLDEKGFVVKDGLEPSWSKFIPPTARVKVEFDGTFDKGNTLVPKTGPVLSAGAFRAVEGDAGGVVRARLLPGVPAEQDFEGFAIDETYPEGAREAGQAYAYPPLPWIGARLKWDIRELDGNKVLAKTLDRVLFQRAITFIGPPNLSDYTLEADVMTDGNRRVMSNVGVINQRYVIALIGNWQQLEVSSNHDRVKVAVPFEWKRNTWYRIKSRVDLAADGSGVVRAKAWQRDGAEPEAWTIEVPHHAAHRVGAPGLFGFSPQSQFKVYVDNIRLQNN